MKAEHFPYISSIFIFVNLSPASAAEISFDDTKIRIFSYANTLNQIGGFAGKADNPYYQMLDENGISSALQSENAAEISGKIEALSISEGALLVRLLNAASPPVSLFFLPLCSI